MSQLEEQEQIDKISERLKKLSKRNTLKNNGIPFTPPKVSISKITFGILSPLEISNIPNIINNSKLGTEKGRLYSLNLGAYQQSQICYTCLNNNYICPGHFGKIQLKNPIINPLFIKILKTVINCVCLNCYKPLYLPVEFDVYFGSFSGHELLNNFEKLADKRKGCPYCKTTKMRVTINKNNLLEIKKDNKSIILTTYFLQELLTKIPRETLEFIGFSSNSLRSYFIKFNTQWETLDSCVFENEIFQNNSDDSPLNIRPEWFIFNELPVLPTCCRPPGYTESFQITIDSLTATYKDIIKAVSNKKAKSDNEVINYIKQLFNNSGISKGTRRQQSDTNRSITQRLKAKQGLIRQNMLGKRTNHNARAPITPDPYVDIDKVIIPSYIANHLTREIKVHLWNIKQCQQLLLTNNVIMIQKGDTILNVKYLPKNKLILKIGDKCHVRLQNGDVTIFNRQPTLHPGSMMTHRILVRPKRDNELCDPGDTIKFNPMVCTPYNADFDGDEMNMHIIQDPEAYTESAELMAVSNHIVTYSSGSNIVSMIQDALLSLYLLTSEKTIFDFSTFIYLLNRCKYISLISSDIMNGMSIKEGIKRCRRILNEEFLFLYNKKLKDKLKKLGYKDRLFLLKCKLKKEKKKEKIKKLKNIISDYNDDYDGMFTGRMLFSLLLPPDFNYTYESEDSKVIIKHGVMMYGRLDKRTMGGGTKTIIKYLALEYPPEVATKILSDIHRVAITYITHRGFSTGWGDFIIFDEHIIDESINKAKITIETVEKEMKSVPSEVKEVYTITELNNISSSINPQKNNEEGIMAMISSGSKGSIVNAKQIMYLMGQQNLSNGRPEELLQGCRAIPWSFPYDKRLWTRGFVKECLKDGMKPSGTYFHLAAGRVGLTDTSAKTPKSGYMNREMTHALDNYIIDSDGTVRNINSGRILQFSYGNNGLNPKKSYKVNGNNCFIDIQREVNRLESKKFLKSLK